MISEIAFIFNIEKVVLLKPTNRVTNHRYQIDFDFLHVRYQ